MGKKVVKLTESDLVRIVKRVLDEQVQPKEEVEAINACRSKFKSQIPESCLAPFEKLDNGEMPDKQSLYTCGIDMMKNDNLGEDMEGYNFIKCIMNVLGKKSTFVNY